MGKSSIIMRQQKNNTRDVPRQPITGFQVSTLWTRGVKDESQGSSKGSDSLQGPQQAGGSSGKHSTRYFSCPQHHKTSFILWPRTGLAQDLAPWSQRDLKACCLFPQLSVHGSGVTSGIKCLGNTRKSPGILALEMEEGSRELVMRRWLRQEVIRFVGTAKSLRIWE